MSTIDNYGEFDLPEEKSTIEIVEDPVKIILACYDLFQKMLKKKFEKSIHPGWKYIYNLALNLFEDKENINLSAKQIEQLMELLPKERDQQIAPYTGFFLSAMHNKINLKTLIIPISLAYSGRKLNPDKNLVICKNSRIFDYGIESKGNIINYGTIQNASTWSGLLINYGQINSMDFVTKGIHINNNKILKLYDSDDIRYINNGDRTQLITGPIKGYVEKGMIFYKNKLLQQNQKLKDKLAEIKFLETLPNFPCEKQVEITDNFNFKKFKTDIEQIVQEIYERNR